MKINKPLNLPRMIDWIVVTILLTLLIAILKPENLSLSLYKLSLIATAAVAGYWIDRSLFPYARPDDLALTDAIERAAAMLRRSIIVGCAMLGVSLGM